MTGSGESLAASALPAGRPGGRRRWVRLGVALAAVLGLLGAGLTGGYLYYNSRLTRVPIRAPGVASPAERLAASDEQNFLVAGSDTRDFAGGSAYQAPAGSAEQVTGQRSDTVLLVHLPAGPGRPTVVSFPRDSYVTIPRYTDALGVAHASYPAKLNEAFAVGGPPLLVQLIENLSGRHVDHYMQVNFAGFQQIVDALGGVTLCVATSRHDHDSGDMLTAGTHADVNGGTALAFVRDRKGLPRSDLDRIVDQQYFLGQVLRKALSAGTLANPVKLNGFLRAATADVTVDQGFGFGQLTALAGRLRHLDPEHVVFATIPIADAGATRPVHGINQSVVLLNPAADTTFFADLDNAPGTAPGTPPGALPGTQAAAGPPRPGGTADNGPPPAPSEVTLTVANATRTPTLAAQTASQLRADGFTIDAVQTVPTTTATSIRYPTGRRPAALTVAAVVPGARLVPDPTLTKIQLILGSSFTGLTPAPAAPPPSPPSTTSTPTATSSTGCAP